MIAANLLGHQPLMASRIPDPIPHTESVIDWVVANSEQVGVGAMVAAGIVAIMLVALYGPEGSLGAYCICWPEKATGTCEFEPVGTHPDHRRKGLASAVMYAAMRRAREKGLRTALV